jgi:copper homeostasis protein CutC
VQLEKIKNVLMELIEKSKRQIIILGGGCRRDNWTQLVQDNPLLNVNAKFEDLVWRKLEIARRRPLISHRSRSARKSSQTSLRSYESGLLE